MELPFGIERDGPATAQAGFGATRAWRPPSRSCARNRIMPATASSAPSATSAAKRPSPVALSAASPPVMATKPSAARCRLGPGEARAQHRPGAAVVEAVEAHGAPAEQVQPGVRRDQRDVEPDPGGDGEDNAAQDGGCRNGTVLREHASPGTFRGLQAVRSTAVQRLKSRPAGTGRAPGDGGKPTPLQAVPQCRSCFKYGNPRPQAGSSSAAGMNGKKAPPDQTPNWRVPSRSCSPPSSTRR